MKPDDKVRIGARKWTGRTVRRQVGFATVMVTGLVVFLGSIGIGRMDAASTAWAVFLSGLGVWFSDVITSPDEW